MPDRSAMAKEAAAQTAAHAAMVAGLGPAWPATLADAAAAIVESLRAGGKLLLAGNGGSAADAQHIAAEFVGRFRRERAALPAIALTTDTSILTSLGNDYSYEIVFARQVEALGRGGDVLWVFSTSGNSANVLRAAESARARGMKVIGFAGGNGGKLAPLCDIALVVREKLTARVQEGHQLAYHVICDLVEAEMACKK
ncbi:MAG: Phosphoheptose isomerase [Phycisphaerae bacterium]|nr:Phosphoheptose isomerase [Phycisphaerae bacterium]